jgi:hypothetical protein
MGSEFKKSVLDDPVCIASPFLDWVSCMQLTHFAEDLRVPNTDQCSSERCGCLDGTKTVETHIRPLGFNAIPTTEGLSAILDQDELVLFCKIDQRSERYPSAEKMHHYNESRLVGACPIESFDGRRQCFKFQIQWDRNQAMPTHDADHVRDSDRAHDHFASFWQME